MGRMAVHVFFGIIKTATPQPREKAESISTESALGIRAETSRRFC